jgi:hypothetical protein
MNSLRRLQHVSQKTEGAVHLAILQSQALAAGIINRIKERPPLGVYRSQVLLMGKRYSKYALSRLTNGWTGIRLIAIVINAINWKILSK